jgi:hypothetical protein
MPAKQNFNAKFQQKNIFFRLKMMCLLVSYQKNMRKKIFGASLKSIKKLVGSAPEPGSISLRYGSGDPDPHVTVTDPQH